MMGGTCWSDGVTVSGCDGGVDVAVRFPGGGLLCQMHVSDLKQKEENGKLQMYVRTLCNCLLCHQASVILTS